MFVHGVGMTKFGFQTTPTHLMVYEAAIEALEDARMTMADVEAIVVATLKNEINGENQRLYGALLSSLFKTHMKQGQWQVSFPLKTLSQESLCILFPNELQPGCEESAYLWLS